MKEGFACEALSRLHQELEIPIIASGGAGRMEHFVDVFNTGHADAALAASIFHFNEISVEQLKKYLEQNNIATRKVYK